MSLVPGGPPPSSPEIIEAAAAAWLSLRERGMSPDETIEFMDWLQQDPRHANTFNELASLWQECDRLAAVPAPARAGAEPDADLLAPRMRRRVPHTLIWSTIAAAAAALVVLLALAPQRAARHTAETVVGAFQKVDLPDGSVAQLNTATAIDTAFSATERRVTIVRGEVFFNVTKDPARPFIVTTGPVAVRAVGTAFNVRQREAAIEVLVTEGRVRVDDASAGRSLLPVPSAAPGPAVLEAGNRAIVPVPGAKAGVEPGATTVESVDAPATRRALAWQERRLEFDGVPLGEVVREFNRYNRQQLVIADPLLAAKRFSGTFRADGTDAFVSLLEADFGIRATRDARTVVLRAGR